jgi:hypothetical protein
MKPNFISKAFSALMVLLLAEFQALAIRGGPYEVGTVSDPYRMYDGTYSLTLVPEENLLDESIDDTTTPVSELETYDAKNPGSALGFAYFLAPAGGVARGSIGLFYNGRLLIGNIAGAIRPSDGSFSFLAQLLAPSPNNFQAFDVTSSTANSTGSSSGASNGGGLTGNTGTTGGTTAATGSANSATSQSSVTTTATLAGAYADGQISGKASMRDLKGSFVPVKMVTLDGRATIRIVSNPENILGDTDSEMVLRFYVTGSRQSTETDYAADALALPFWVNSLSNTNLSLSSLNRNTSAATQPTNTNQPDRLPALPANATTTANEQRRVTPGSATFIQTLFRPVGN